jgi:hypothetical protein
VEVRYKPGIFDAVFWTLVGCVLGMGVAVSLFEADSHRAKYVLYIETVGGVRLYKDRESWTVDLAKGSRYIQVEVERLCPPTVGAPICHVARVEECVRE